MTGVTLEQPHRGESPVEPSDFSRVIPEQMPHSTHSARVRSAENHRTYRDRDTVLVLATTNHTNKVRKTATQTRIAQTRRTRMALDPRRPPDLQPLPPLGRRGSAAPPRGRRRPRSHRRPVVKVPGAESQPPGTTTHHYPPASMRVVTPEAQRSSEHRQQPPEATSRRRTTTPKSRSCPRHEDISALVGSIRKSVSCRWRHSPPREARRSRAFSTTRLAKAVPTGHTGKAMGRFVEHTEGGVVSASVAIRRVPDPALSVWWHDRAFSGISDMCRSAGSARRPKMSTTFT